MRQDSWVICDSETGYVKKLADYLRGKVENHLDIRTYSTIYGLFKEETGRESGVLIIEDSMYEEWKETDEFKQLHVQKVMCLTKEKQGIENLVRLEARTATAEGCKEIAIRDLIRTALRMRPDRIIVGEVRGAEAIDMLQALNVGQDGSLSTIHANSAKDALSRLETMIMLHTEIPLMALRRQIVSGIDLIIHLGRMRDKSRKVLEIRELNGIVNNEIETRILFSFEETEEKTSDQEKVIGKLIKSNTLTHTLKLKRAGITYEI